MSNNERRGQPSKYFRKKHAVNAAKHRWKHKWKLVPGRPRSWSERSYANKLQHMAAARRGGAATGGQIKEQQRLFWRFYHGNCKDGLAGAFRTVVDTFELIEADYERRCATTGARGDAWDGFFADMLYAFVFTPCAKKDPEQISRDLWALYEKFMTADDGALYGTGAEAPLLQTLFDFEEAQEEKQQRIQMWRSKNAAAQPRMEKKI